MAVEGSLDLFQLPEILQVVSQQNKTGILTIQGADDIVAISFLNGRIVAADSLTETTEKGVGEVLVTDGLVDPQILRQLSDKSTHEGTRLGDLLVSGGTVDREQFLAALRTHTLQLLMSLLGWTSGEFKFYGGDEVSYEDGFRPIGVDELLLRSIEESEEQERRSLPDPSARLVRNELGPSVEVRAVDELGDELPAPEDGVVRLTPEEDRVLQEVSPERTVEEVAQAAGVPLDRVRYVLYRLSKEEVLATAPEPQAAPPSTASPSAPDDGFLADLAPAPDLDPPKLAAPTPDPEPAPAPTAQPDLSLPTVEMPTPEQRSEAHPAARLKERPAPRARARPVPAPAEAQGLPISGLLGLVLGALTLVVLLVAPSGFLTPFPWLEPERASFFSSRDATLRLKIDQAAKTFFLTEGRFPDSLGELVDSSLLSSEDLSDASGHALAYDVMDGAYEVRALGEIDGTPAFGEATRKGVKGNFLLDPEFGLGGSGLRSSEVPLVLLD